LSITIPTLSNMASTSQTHPAFPSRPYGSSTLHTSSKLPDRSSGAPLAFGASSHTHNAREAARQERERQERDRAQQAQQQQQAGTSAAGVMAQLTDEQRDEINEAVSHISPSHLPCLKSSIHIHASLLRWDQWETVQPLRPRQRLANRLPRVQSRSQSPRVRPAQARTPKPPNHPRHPSGLKIPTKQPTSDSRGSIKHPCPALTPPSYAPSFPNHRLTTNRSA
jgi:hypothetical protein